MTEAQITYFFDIGCIVITGVGQGYGFGRIGQSTFVLGDREVVGIGFVGKTAEIAVAGIVAVGKITVSLGAPGVGFRGTVKKNKVFPTFFGSKFDTGTDAVGVKFILQMTDKVSPFAVAGRADPAFIILRIEFVSEGELFFIGKAPGSAGGCPCRRERRQQHCRQNGDDSDYNQEFDQSKFSIHNIPTRFSVILKSIQQKNCRVKSENARNVKIR